MATTKTYTAVPADGLRLELSQAAGEIRIVADAYAKRAYVSVGTEDNSGSSADAVNGAVIKQLGERLLVSVQALSDGTPVRDGNTTVADSGNVIFANAIVGTGRVTVNGVDVTGSVDHSRRSGIVTTVVVPRGSDVRIDTASADTAVTGAVGRLDYEGSSGSLRAQTARVLDVGLTSGSIAVDQVTERLAALLSSGSLLVREYNGSEGQVACSSGSVVVHAAPGASGKFFLRVSSGHAVLTGVTHLDVRQHAGSGSIKSY